MAISTQDLITGFDPTSAQQLTGAQLAAMVNNATPTGAGTGVGTGLVITTTDSNGIPQPPNGTTTPKWQNYIWNRIIPNSNSMVSYVWNPGQSNNIVYSDGSGNYVTSYWNAITQSAIPAGSIQGYQLATATVASANIISVTQAQVQGLTTALASTVSLTTNPLITTQIYGNFTTGFFLTNNSVTSAAFAAGAISAAAGAPNPGAIANGGITLAKFDNTGTLNQILSNPTAGNPGWTTPPQIYTGLANPNSGGSNDGQLVAVNSGAQGTFKYVLPPIVKTAFASSTTSYTTTTTSADSASAPTNVVDIAALDTSYTPTSNNNYLIVTVIIPAYTSGNAATWVYLYSGANILGAARLYSTAAITSTLSIKVKITTPGTSAISFYTKFASTNSTDGAVSKYGETASLSIEEFTI